jgi:hypothetical protein
MTRMRSAASSAMRARTFIEFLQRKRPRMNAITETLANGENHSIPAIDPYEALTSRSLRFQALLRY